MSLPDISSLNYDQLSDLIEAASHLQKKKKQQEKAALLDAFKAQAKAKGMTLEEIISGKASTKGSRKPVPAKYRNPDDASQTWTGRGRKPLWVVDALANGASMSSIEI